MKKKNALIRIVYIWLHPIICFILLITTNALVQLSEKTSNTYSPTTDTSDFLKKVISIGLCLTVFLMIIMRIMHKGLIDHLKHPNRCLHIIFKLIIALLHYLIYYIIKNSLYFILLQSLLTTTTNMLEMLIPIHSKSRTVNILERRTTADAGRAPGAQKEYNDNRKSILATINSNYTKNYSSSVGGSGGCGDHSSSPRAKNTTNTTTASTNNPLYNNVLIELRSHSTGSSSGSIRNALQSTTHPTTTSSTTANNNTSSSNIVVVDEEAAEYKEIDM